MGKTSKNLGLVQAIFVGTTPPNNIAQLWHNLGDGLPYYYNTLTSNWETLVSVVIPPPIPPPASSIVELGKSLFVSSKGDTVANGALRESLSNHFSSLTEARTASLSGDTIYVYGDQIANTNLFKNGVTWEFMGNPTITNNQVLFADGGLAGTCVIRGNANFQSTNGVFNFTAVGTIIDIECQNAVTTSGVACQLVGTIGTINVSDKTQSSTGATYYIDGATNVVINGKNIIGLKNNGLTFNIRSTFAGDLTVNAHYISGIPTVANSSVVFIDGTLPTLGKVTFNISNKIELLGAGTTCQAVRPCNGITTVNGNIEGGVGYAIRMFSPSTGSDFTHNGKATNDGSLETVNIDGNNVVSMELNGEYDSSNENVIVQDNPNSTLTINGKIKNTNALAVVKSGILISDNAATLFNNVKVIMDIALGTPASIGAAAAKNIKVIHSFGSNAGISLNITNLIPGSILNVDSDYE